MRLPTYDKPRIIACAQDHSKHIGLPRGCLDEVRQTLSDLNIKAVVRDERNPGQPLKATFQGELRPEQTVAARAMLAHDTGVLAATTAFGKTVVAAWLIAQRGVNTLVLVHRRQLQHQWTERLSTFLGMPARTIGRIGGGRTKPTGLVDVAVIQSLVRSGLVDDLVSNYGHLIVDECHHLSAQSFEQVARQAKAKFVTGLSATVTRKDGQHPIIFMECGPVRYRVSVRHGVATHPFEHRVVVRPTGFRPLRPADPDVRVQFHKLYEELIADENDRMLAILSGDRRRQARHELRLSLAGNLLKALGREMVALIHNEVPIIAHEIVDEATSHQALYHCYIDQAGWFCAATADPANSARRHSKEGRKTLGPLMLQLPPMYQNECIHAPLGNQPRGNDGLSEGGRGCQHSRIMGEHRTRGNGLLGSQFALECRLQRLAGVALVPDHGLDVQV